MIRRLIRLFKVFKGVGDDLNRRVEVENYLWGVVNGRTEPPDITKCRELALKLGVPTSFRKNNR